MASPWTDESSIQRDLSFAQGRWVPGGIDSAVAGGRPPTLNITEETEEEYYLRWTSDGDFSAGPDLFRIKKMLELCQDSEDSLKISQIKSSDYAPKKNMQDEDAPDDDIPSGPIEITKLNPRAGPIIQTPLLNPKAVTFVPKTKTQKAKENKDPAPNKTRRARNVAIASILARNNHSTEAQEPLKLCKPEHFMKSKDDNEMEERQQDSIDKVTNWLQAQDSQDIIISSMFKKKSSVSSAKISSIRDCGTVSMVKQSPVKSQQDDSEKCSSVRSPQNEPYQPSSWADEYYKKAVDRSYMRDLVRDNVWGRAEKVMKRIDEDKAEELRKQQEAAALAAELAAAARAMELSRDRDHDLENDGETKVDETCQSSMVKEDLNEDKSDGIGHILLGQHRHSLQAAAACAVCAVLAPARALCAATAAQCCAPGTRAGETPLAEQNKT